MIMVIVHLKIDYSLLHQLISSDQKLSPPIAPVAGEQHEKITYRQYPDFYGGTVFNSPFKHLVTRWRFYQWSIPSYAWLPATSDHVACGTAASGILFSMVFLNEG